MALIAVMVQIAAKFGLELDEAATLTLISPILIAILGQGIADHGKSAAAIAAATPVDPTINK